MIKLKVLICSAWPYCHSVPHLGNLIGSLLSGDVFSRYYKIKGHDCLYVSGTDAHGTRTEYESIKQGVSPRDIFQENHKKILDILKGFEIEFDTYTSTESSIHKDFVTQLYKKIDKNGFIFKKTEKRAYCKSCKIFLADRFIEGTCPKCKTKGAKGNQCDACGQLLEAEELIKPICSLCSKSKIEFKETTHWFLDLVKLKPELEKYVNSHKEWKGNVKQFTLNFLKNIRPRAVTRDLKWGIEAPFEGAEGKVIYVWAEAALGYVSATIEHTKDWKDYWFGNVKHIYTIAKDNVPFHTIFFPAQLITSKEGYHLPDQIAATEYLNWVEGKKFSKSRNIGIFCDDALKLLSATYWRFYLLYNRPETRDTNFSWIDFEKAINQTLISEYLNFVNRVTTLAYKEFNGKVEKVSLSKEDKKLLDQIKIIDKNISKIIEAGQLAPAVKEILSLCKLGNTYFQKREPWKTKDKAVLYTCLQLIKAISIFFYPFIPSVSKTVWSLIGIGKQEWSGIYEEFKSGTILQKPQIILERVDVNKLKKFKSTK